MITVVITENNDNDGVTIIVIMMIVYPRNTYSLDSGEQLGQALAPSSHRHMPSKYEIKLLSNG